MSTGKEDLGGARDAGSRRGRAWPYAMGWAAAAIVAALTMSPGRRAAAETGPPAAEPTPYQKPQYWGVLPAPTALVHVSTPVGEFTLPMGYLTDWFVLRDQAIWTGPDLLRRFSGGLDFQFEYPGGWMNANAPFVQAVHDAAGRVVDGRTVVFVNEVKPSDRDGEELAAATLGRYPPGSLVHNAAFSRPDHETLDGTAAGSGPGHRIGVQLSCGIDCHFDLYLEHQQLVMSGVLDGRFRHDGLAVAEQVQALFERWQTAPIGKEDLEGARDAGSRQGRTGPYAMGWAAAAIVAAPTMSPGRPAAAETGPVVAGPTPYQKPLLWGGLPAPTALVHVSTPIGAFTLPMGYVSNWFVLRDQSVSTAPDGLRQFSSGLAYQFEYPGAWMNANTPWVRAVHDAAGRVVDGRTVVFVDEVKPSDRDGEELAAATLGRYPPGSLVHNAAYSRPEHETLDGTAAGSGPGHRIGVRVSCEIDCHLDLYLEYQHLVMVVLLDGRFRHDGLAVAEQVQALFERWQTAPIGKGN